MLIKHIPGLFLNPKVEWQNIRNGKADIKRVYLGLVLLLAAIPPVCGFIGTTMVGWSVGSDFVIKLSNASALKIAIIFYFAILAAILVVGWMIRWMGDTYGFSRSPGRCVQLAAFTATPLLLIGVFLLFSEVWIIYLIGMPAVMFSVYLLYTGVPVMLDISKEKGFLLSSAILAVGLVTLVGLLVSTVIFWGMGIEPSFVN